ncbi:MAG TPA: hypothetical protein VFT43_03280 [Candidatus Polarisedimenticolia bacterium]|nr:hypothetical protein [Candidatus Polarisedimenticolia bacterium]
MARFTESRFVSEIKQVRRTLRVLDHSLLRLVPILTDGTRVRPRRRAPLSSKARASLVLQGRYMGYMRQLKPRQKLLIRKIRETKGVRTAISKARQLAQA